jgi:hypothetical protein
MCLRYQGRFHSRIYRCRQIALDRAPKPYLPDRRCREVFSNCREAEDRCTTSIHLPAELGDQACGGRAARRRTGDASRPLRISPSISRLRERNSYPFTKNGMDVASGAASNCNMGQSNSSGRCEHCGGLMVLVLPVDGKGPGAFRCLECDQIDPLKLPSITAWLVGELRPPK